MTTGIVVATLVGVLGLWLWGRPREHVARPTASSTPQQVVSDYVRALDRRDFATAAAIAPTDGSSQLHWWTLRPAQFSDVRINQVTSPATPDAGSGDTGWKQLAFVDTTVTMRHGDGTGETTSGEQWRFTLGRQGDTQPWQIVDQGQG